MKVCKTDGAVYEIVIRQTEVICKVYLPAEFAQDSLKIFKLPISVLKQLINYVMEEALSPLFPQYEEKK
jgi:hypothetical protein